MHNGNGLLGHWENFRASWENAVLTHLLKLQNLEATSSLVTGLDVDPVATLNAFEKLSDGPWKRYVWRKNEEVLKAMLEEREWRKTKAEAQKTEAGTRAPAGSLASQYESLMRQDAVLGRKFFEVHRAEIETEHDQWAHHHVARNAVPVTSRNTPQTL